MRNAVGVGAVTVTAWHPISAAPKGFALCHVVPNDASPHVCPRSPSRPRWPSTPRPRRCRRRARTSSASAPASPTSRRPAHIVEAAVAACRDPKNHRYTPAGGLPELQEAIAAEDQARQRVRRAGARQVLVTNGGKHAVFTAFAALCDPGDEVICPAPYWTTYPEAITLAGGVPVVIDTTEETGFQVTVDQLEAAYTERTKVLLFVSPDNPSGAVYPPEQVRGDRPVGGRAGRVGDHRRDLRAPHVRAARVLVDADARAGPRRPVHRRQRRRQDVRHDRVAGRLDDRPGRRHQGGDQLPEPRHVERRQRLPAGRAGRGQRRPRRRRR